MLNIPVKNNTESHSQSQKKSVYFTSTVEFKICRLVRQVARSECRCRDEATLNASDVRMQLEGRSQAQLLYYQFTMLSYIQLQVNPLQSVFVSLFVIFSSQNRATHICDFLVIRKETVNNIFLPLPKSDLSDNALRI